MQYPAVLVLGATGRIGRILRLEWPKDPNKIVPIWQTRRATASGQWLAFDPLQDPQACLRAAQNCDAILCLSGVIPNRQSQGATLQDNIALAEVALRVGAASGARVLLSSSAAVYGNQPGLLSETSPLQPANAYGQAKADMEVRAAEIAEQNGVSYCALRIGNIAGIDSILGQWRPGFQLDQFDNTLTPRRSYIGPRSLSRVLHDLVLSPSLPHALNVAAPRAIEMGALLQSAGLPWIPRPAPTSAIAEVQLDTTALTAFTSFTAAEATTDDMVAQWHLLEPNMTQNET